MLPLRAAMEGEPGSGSPRTIKRQKEESSVVKSVGQHLKREMKMRGLEQTTE